ncbi:MAG: globin domain-containing protein [Chitinophagaceae bacterium]
MTGEQILLIKRSWKIFRGIDPQLVGDTFYSKLFMDNPSLRRMFPQNMDLQYKKLVDMLSTIVARLTNFTEVTNDMAAMAKRHASYGVRPAHYALVGAALLWTLEQGLGKDWTEETKNAWTTCYTMLANTMMNASS